MDDIYNKDKVSHSKEVASDLLYRLIMEIRKDCGALYYLYENDYYKEKAREIVDALCGNE